MMMRKPSTILILSFVVITGYLIRENWDLVPQLNVVELVEPKAAIQDSVAAESAVETTSDETIIPDPVFEAFLDEITERLPTMEQYQYLTGAETHGHPRLLLETALDFGQLAERLQSNVSLRPKGLQFYKGCALNNELVTSVRAVCFHHAQVLEIDLHARIWETDQIPSNVVELAKTL